MKNYKQDFIQFCLRHNVLRFGDFTLKSGRQSPYFFNSGLFNNGETLALLGDFYAAAIADNGIEFEVLFGPAYKGIPLVCSTAIALASMYEKNYPYVFNRKEAKDHGEGGVLVGAEITHKPVLIIDDVISAGTAIRESIEIISSHNATVAGIVIAMDRQEKGNTELSAIEEITQRYQIPVIAIITLDDLIQFIETTTDKKAELEKIRAYRQQYGVC